MEILIVVIAALGFLWVITIPNRKMQRSQAQTRNNLAPGDEVMTGAGLYGTVVQADGDVIVLETSPGVQQRWARGAILRKVDPLPPDEASSGTVEDVEDLESEVDEFEVPDDPSSLDPDGKKP